MAIEETKSGKDDSDWSSKETKAPVAKGGSSHRDKVYSHVASSFTTNQRTFGKAKLARQIET